MGRINIQVPIYFLYIKRSSLFYHCFGHVVHLLTHLVNDLGTLLIRNELKQFKNIRFVYLFQLLVNLFLRFLLHLFCRLLLLFHHLVS